MTVLVFGSINADFFVNVPALPKPGETALAPTYRTAAGGKGANQAVAAARAGAKVAMIGRIGADAFGRSLKDGLASEGIDVAGIASSGQPTGAAFIAIDPKGENLILGAGGANLDARAADVPDARLGPATTVVLQMEVSPTETARLAARARKSGARVMLNLAPALMPPHGLIADTGFLVVNEHEAVALASHLGLSERTPAAIASAIVRRYAGTVVVTLGAEGALAVAMDGTFRIGALQVGVVDTVGAGDAFVGVLAACLDEGRNLPTALRRASVAGALACTTAGAQAGLPTRAALDAREGELAPARPF
jgi:ribokinase